MPSEQDKIFAEQAIKLAESAAGYIEESYSYVDGINDVKFKEETERKVNDIISEA